MAEEKLAPEDKRWYDRLLKEIAEDIEAKRKKIEDKEPWLAGQYGDFISSVGTAREKLVADPPASPRTSFTEAARLRSMAKRK